MYYFIYCTYMLEDEMRKYLPEATHVTKATAANHEIQFRASGDRTDRGWCHLADVGTLGKTVRGMVVECDDARVNDNFDDFDIVFITVQGDDGKNYDCFTYVLSQPGIRMRPPRYYWERVPNGYREQGFDEDYVQSIEKVFDDAAECPDFERPMPAGAPGKDASSR